MGKNLWNFGRRKKRDFQIKFLRLEFEEVMIPVHEPRFFTPCKFELL